MAGLSNPNSEFANWKEPADHQLAHFYNEIKSKKVLEISWSNPGRLDPKVVDEKLTSTARTDSVSQMEVVKVEPIVDQNPRSVPAFDLFDELADDLEKNSAKHLRITHKKAIEDPSSKRVACMDKILHDLRKNYDSQAKVVDDAIGDARGLDQNMDVRETILEELRISFGGEIVADVKLVADYILDTIQN